MKAVNLVRAALATGTSLAIAFGTASCSRDYTSAYVYVTTNAAGATGGSVSAYAVDYQSGVLTQLAGSPFTAGIGRNPVTEVASPNGKNLYVVSKDDSTITEFGIGTDGKLYGQHTYNSIGTLPVAAAIDSTGKFLYVASTFQSGYSPTSGGPGDITIFPIAADGSLGAATSVNVGVNPVGIAVSKPGTIGATAGSVYVYVVDQEGGLTGAATPYVVGFSQNTSTGALTLLPGSTCSTTAPTVCTGYRAGVLPSAIAIDPTTSYVYVTDKSTNQILGYRITNSSSGATLNGTLTALPTSPFGTGLYPAGITIDPRGKYLLTANYNANSVSSFSINLSDGSLGGTASAGSAQVATGPTCVTIEPALGIYVYTSNSIDNSVSALQISPNTGALSGVPNTPYPSGSLPSCVVSVANGDHANSIVNP